MGIGEGNSLDNQSQEEGQPAAPPSADAIEGTGRPDPITPSGGDHAARGGKPRKRRRKVKRRARHVAPAEPGEREAAAASALADMAPPAEPAAPGAEPDEDVGAPPEGEPDLDAGDLAQLADESAPVFRVAFKGAAIGLRRRFPTAARSFYEGADLRSRALAGTLGLRLAARLGMKLSLLAMLAEVVEPFLADRWEARG